MSTKANMMPIISNMYCSSSQSFLVVRRRPHVVNGGGFVVTDCSQNTFLRVDGCGVLGTKGEIVVRDAYGDAVVLIRRKALGIYKRWKGYAIDYEGSQKLVFSLKEPPSSNSCLVTRNDAIRISTETRAGCSSSKSCKFEIKGYFPDKDCSIVDSTGNTVAQIGVQKEVKELMESKDLYHILVKPGIDQAFVVAVIATVDYIYGESTKC